MALNAALAHAEKMSFPVDLNDREALTKIVSTYQTLTAVRDAASDLPPKRCVGTKYTNRFGRLMIDLAMDAITTVMVDSDGRKEIDVKRYAKIEKIPGGDIEDSRVSTRT